MDQDLKFFQSATPKIHSALLGAARTGQIVRIAMTFGSTPGEPVERYIEELREDEGIVMVCRIPSGEVVGYKLFHILWMETASGLRLTNNAAIRRRADAFSGMEARAVVSATIQEAVRADQVLSFGARRINVLQEVSVKVDGEPRTFYALQSSWSNRVAVIHAASRDDAQRLCALLGGHSFWETVDVLLRCQCFWPVWLRVRQEIREEADFMRAGALTLRARERERQLAGPNGSS